MRHQGRQFCGAASPASLTLSKVPASLKYQNRKLVGNCKLNGVGTKKVLSQWVMSPFFFDARLSM
jgi:hypothetical protein